MCQVARSTLVPNEKRLVLYSLNKALEIHPAKKKRVKGVQQRGVVRNVYVRESVSVSAQDRVIELRSGLFPKFQRRPCPQFSALAGLGSPGLRPAGSAAWIWGAGLEGEGSREGFRAWLE